MIELFEVNGTDIVLLNNGFVPKYRLLRQTTIHCLLTLDENRENKLLL